MNDLSLSDDMWLSNGQDFRRAIIDVEHQIGAAPQIDPPVFHHFSEGCYAREMHLAAGSVIVGKIHRHQHPIILSAGKISVSSESGSEIIEAPRTWVSEAGTKRLIYAHTDAVLTTIHITDSTDLEEIEREVIAESYEKLLEEGS